MMRTRTLRLDFAAAPRGPSAGGLILCAVGLGVAIAVGSVFRDEIAERARLEGAVEELNDRHKAPAETPAQAAEQAEISKMQRELSIPWTPLLADLEAASADMANEVSLLQVEPDAEKNVVRITAEVRTLTDALAYLQRLQKSPLLRYPMLESHERKKDDPLHPLRIKLSAEWRP